MDYFNKDEFQQLKNLPRSASQKRETMHRIQNSSGRKKQTRNYPVTYVVTSIAVLLLTILLIGPELFSSKQQANEPPEVTPDTPIIDPGEVTDDDDTTSSILNKIEIGMSEEEVKQLLGKYYSTGEWKGTYENGDSIWRYEIEKSGEYIFEIDTGTQQNYLKFEAMNKGTIEMLLFILWDNQHTVKHYSAIYKDSTDAQIYDIRVLQNGTVLKQSIYPTENVNTENIMIDIELLKTQIKIGMTMEDVKSLLGNHYKTTVDVDSGKLIWNYNFGKEPDKDKDDFIDYDEFERMLQGEFQAEIGILWDVNNSVSSLYGIYKNDNENKIYEYRVFPDGQSKDNPIYPF